MLLARRLRCRDRFSSSSAIVSEKVGKLNGGTLKLSHSTSSCGIRTRTTSEPEGTSSQYDDAGDAALPRVRCGSQQDRSATDCEDQVGPRRDLRAEAPRALDRGDGEPAPTDVRHLTQGW